jgi:hypothetical protein
MFTAPDPHDMERAFKTQDFPQLQAIRALDLALFDTKGPCLIIPPRLVQPWEILQWHFLGIDVYDYGGTNYREA